jgi:hypothetical protein
MLVKFGTENLHKNLVRKFCFELCPSLLPADEDENSFIISLKFVIVNIYHTGIGDLNLHTAWLQG